MAESVASDDSYLIDIDHIDSLVVAFHDAIAILCSALFTDPTFNVNIHGYGFNGVPLPIGLLTQGTSFQTMNTEEDCDFFGLLSNYGCQAYHVFRNAVALGDNAALDEFVGSEKIVFNATQTEIPGYVELSLSSRMFCKLNDWCKFLDLKDAVKIMQSFDGSQKFYFHSRIADKILHSYVNNLAIVRPTGLFGIDVQNENLMKVKPYIVEHLGDNIQGVKCKFAIQSPDWPGNVEHWITRHKPSNWPNSDTIHSLVEGGVSIVPAELLPSVYELSEDVSEKGYWQYSFAHAEKQLILSLTPEAKMLYKIILGFVEPIEHLCGIDNYVLHNCFLHSFFWYCEENVSSIDCSDHIQRRNSVQTFLNYMHGLMSSNGKFCNYFIPEADLNRSLTERDFERLKETIDSLVKEEEFLDNTLKDTTLSSVITCFITTLEESYISDFLAAVTDKIQNSFTNAFMGMLKMTYHSLFAKLHASDDMQHSAEFHHRMLQSIKSQKCDPEVKDWFVRLVSSSLGNIYLARAQQSQVEVEESSSQKLLHLLSSPKKVPTNETFYFLQKAEEMLLTGNNVDLIAGRVKLASFYFMNHQFKDCCELVDEIFHVTGATDSYVSTNQSLFASSNGLVSANSFLETVAQRNMILDVLLSHSEKSTLPPFMSQNINLTRCSFLGNQKTPVYVMDADIYAHFLHAMCHHYLGDTEMAVSILEKLENLWNKAQFDLNEKRNISYLNMIASCYLEIGRIEKCEKVLDYSHKQLPNAIRNPAYFRLLKIRSEKPRKVAKATLSVAVGVGIIASVFGIFKNRLL